MQMYCSFASQNIFFHAGVDEKTIIDVLVKRSNEQRQKIKEAYQQSTGKVSGFS